MSHGVDVEIVESTKDAAEVNRLGVIRVNRMWINGMEVKSWPLDDPPEVYFEDKGVAKIRVTMFARSVRVHAEQARIRNCGTPIYDQLAAEIGQLAAEIGVAK